MKHKKTIIFSILIVFVILIITSICFYILNDKQRLSVSERQWINDNNGSVISLNVINDLNVFGKEGKGVYYDFLTSLEENYDLQINPVIYSSEDQISGIAFGCSLNKDALISFYEDHFVLVSKKEEIVKDMANLEGANIGVLDEYKQITQDLKQNEIITYTNKEEMEKSFNETTDLDYLLVPKYMYLDSILSYDFNIVYHLSDKKIYYGLTNDGSEFSSIISKYFNRWKKENLNDSINKNEFDLFVTSLNIASADIDNLRANSYTFGFVNNAPYEIISGGTFGGINAVYLKNFADLVDVEINFVKFNKFEKLEKDIKNNKINLYFDYYNTTYNFEPVSSNLIIPYVVLAKQNDSTVIHSLKSLEGKTVYVEKNSKLYDALKKEKKINIKTYETKKELKKIIKNESILLMDTNKYESYKNNLLDQYNVRYSEKLETSYHFIVNANSTFTKLFDKYLKTLDSEEIKYSGINNYFVTKKSGTLLGTLARYILVLIGILAIIVIIIYKKSKKITIAKKIKKEDKMRFIDQLTSLKNRNYLNENLENWNNNTIYPQAVIVLDLNKLQDINDTLGYEQGDTQIQAAANILIKTQLDKTDVIRTDGNEFLIYLVGYELKQITSYIHKLNKEFKKLPFDYGVAIGYSMITDDVKSVEDAINEAVEQVKTQKDEKKDE